VINLVIRGLRVQENLRETKEFIARVYESPLYDAMLGDVLRPGGLKLTARAAEVAGISRASFVLDIASGRGATACFLSQHYSCSVIGIDLSAKLISQARSKARDERLSGETEFLVGDAESLPFKDSMFDVVISECSFSLLLNKEAAAAEFWRVLRPGGKLAITDMVLHGQLTRELQTRSTFASCIAGAKPLEEYIKLFQKAGFAVPCVEDHSEELKRLAYRMLVGCGSLEDFSAGLPGNSGTHHEEDIDAAASAEVWRGLFRLGRPGYALIAMTRL